MAKTYFTESTSKCSVQRVGFFFLADAILLRLTYQHDD